MAGRIAAIALALAIGLAAVAGALVWRDWSSRSEAMALRARIAELTDRGLTQGSPLSCLAGDVGEAVETACERIVFAKPEAAATAIAYTAARIALIIDATDYARRADPAFAENLNGIRRAIELDRFGLAAQVLSTRDGCTVDTCAFFRMVRDPNALKANIKAHAYETYVSRYAPVWTGEEKVPVAEKTPEPAPAAAAVSEAPPSVATGVPVSSKYSFPSAASIPPVSIMNAEPPLPAPDAKAKAEAEKAPVEKQSLPAAPLPLPAKRPQTEAAAPAAR
ncbi:MAG: hypothetical protein JO254_16560 [Pseudolabrys sp.]|nr:hypothetical protein [Pseudolabrys sp.]